MKTVVRAAIYIRVSSKEQATDDKVSLEVQQRDCESYCRRKGYEIAGVPYIDIQSGTDSRKERASFEQMLADARKGNFDIIVAWRPDRLFRSLWSAARLKQVMDVTGVDVETVTQPIDKSTLGLWAWVAEREIENIRERTLMGREALARAGKLVTGNPPYGSKYDHALKQLRHSDGEKPHVITMFDWVDQSKSVNSLVTHFNKLGVLTRYGKPWKRQQVIKILRNPIYMGKAYWGRHESKHEVGTNRTLISVEPIVTEELFNRVQRQLDKNRTVSPRNTRQTYLLQHLLQCRSCGQSFRVRSRTSRRGIPLKMPERYYGCRGMHDSPGAYHCRRPAELNASILESAVWDAVAGAFANPQALLEILEARSATAGEKTLGIRTELETAQSQLLNKRLELQQLLTWARQRLLTADELRPQLAQVREQEAHWRQEINRLNQKLSSLEAADKNLADAEQLCLTVRNRLAGGLTELEKKEFLSLLVERVWVDKDNDMEIEIIVPGPQTQTSDVNCETVCSFKGEGEDIKKRGCAPLRHSLGQRKKIRRRV